VQRTILTSGLTPEHTDLYCKCLEDWSPETLESGDHKRRWYDKYGARGLRVRLSFDDKGTVAGMIQFLPIEHSFAEGRDLYVVLCIWVHGHKQGRGDFRGRGMGQALLAGAEAEARDLGAKGMAAWGLWLPFWMKASWFRRQGYRRADRDGIRVLMWKPFSDEARPPRWIRRRKKPGRTPGVVSVTSFLDGWCTAQNIVHERAKRAAAEFGDRIVFQTIDTSERDVFLEWGIGSGLFVDGDEVRTGPPPSYDKLRRLIERRVARLPRSR